MAIVVVVAMFAGCESRNAGHDLGKRIGGTASGIKKNLEAGNAKMDRALRDIPQ